MDSVRKRKLDSTNDDESGKRPRMTSSAAVAGSSAVPPVPVVETGETSAVPELVLAKGKGKAKETSANAPVGTASRPRINKLAPPRPFPTVPTSVSATGPRSSHKEGKNFICLSRKTPLGGYMRRCKDVIIKDGYKTLHLTAMGAAIPLLLQLTCALPPILPFSKDEIHTEVTTGTVEVQDEVIPEDDEEDITYQTRGKSTVKVVFKIGNGEFEGDRTDPIRKYSKSGGGKNKSGSGEKDNNTGKQKDQASSALVFQEPEQEFMDML